jgi:hypothetical protein
VNSALNIPEDRTEEFLKNVTRFVQANHVQLENVPYILVLANLDGMGKMLTRKDVVQSCGLGKCVFFVDEKMRLSKTEDGEARISNCSSLTDQGKLFAVLVTDTYIYKILCGKTIDELDVAGATKNPLVGPKWHRPMSEFDTLLTDHYESHVKNEQVCVYWSNKAKRILLSGKHGTEDIFHRSLFWWLKNFVSNKLRVYAQPKGIGQDETDIIVVTVEGSHLIEVKWLGENENGTTYEQDQINVGLAQIKIYLDADAGCVCGYLVVYDGRSLGDHETKSDHDNSYRHSRCETPRILFLESQPPSKKALQVVKQSNQ